MVTVLFPDREAAERGFKALTDRGYSSDDINLVMSDETRRREFTANSDESVVTTELGNKAAKGAGIGGAVGGTLGAIAAAIATVGTSVAIPGLGIVVAGPLAAALAGAGAGGITGGLIGALIGAGIPEERVKHYEEGIKRGGILMGVRPRSKEDAAYVEREWRNAGGKDLHH
jgi:hypothetical protein